MITSMPSQLKGFPGRVRPLAEADAAHEAATPVEVGVRGEDLLEGLGDLVVHLVPLAEGISRRGCSSAPAPRAGDPRRSRR
jgi:hypothetical protein